MSSDTAKAEELLRSERERLVRQLAELGAAEDGELRSDIDFGGSFADAAAVTAERTEVLGLVETLRGQVEDIDKALERIEEGLYGTCANCGKEISPDRLAALPASILCVECKSKGVTV
ncbi:MAG: TraR/DksA C4-type zinc finger protein [Acidimicrobiales bacterium]|jgi:DnaK suppressor protein|nr:TraR/DksA C4-type zinc finger protein [Acidimicrobiales bacterium]HLV89929.1 TraR/DksA C4-type zinc finger protein [Acidimicrobiia bacterium]